MDVEGIGFQDAENFIKFKHGYQREDGKVVVNLRPDRPKYRALLSIDGGGVRGIVPAVVLHGFEAVAKKVVRELHPEVLAAVPDEDLIVNVKDHFDMVAGNSAGSILALYIASGGGTKELYEEGGLLRGMEPGSAAAGIAMVDRFVKKALRPRWHAVIPSIKPISGMFFSRYGNKGLAEALRDTFGELTMSNLSCNAFVPAFELENARPVGFYASAIHGNSSGPTSVPGYLFPKEKPPSKRSLGITPQGVPISGHFESRDFNPPVCIVAQASSSAPVYFSPTEHRLPPDMAERLGLDGDKISWADGGLVSNNPTMQALSFMASLYSDEETKGMLHTNKMAVLSLGTGTRRQKIHVGGGKGLSRWLWHLGNTLMEAHNWVNHQIVDGLFDGGILGHVDDSADRYIRINKVVPIDSPDYEVIGSLDTFKHLDRLKEIGKELVQENHDLMKDFIEKVLMLEEN